MTKDDVAKLTQVLADRLQVQYENEEDPHANYTYDELLTFAIEEAWENDELDFLISARMKEELRGEIERIIGVHESPHTPSNCRLCRVSALLDK